MFHEPVTIRNSQFLIRNSQFVMRASENSVVGEATDKSQVAGNDFCQFYMDFQVHEVGLGVWIG